MPPAVNPRALGVALACVAAATLALEVALTRLASALFFTQVTAVLLAVSLAALGLGAAFAHRLTARRPPTVLQLGWLAAATGLAAVIALVCATQAPLLFIAGAFAVPFLLAGAFAAVAYQLSPRPTATFAWEALGGACGAALGPLLLAAWGELTAALVALLLLVPAALLVRARRALVLLLPVPLLLAAHLTLTPSPLAWDPYATPLGLPHLVEQTRGLHGRVLQTRNDSYARTDLVQTDEPWLRYLYTDRMYAARVVRWDGHAPQFPDAAPNTLARLKRLPFAALQPARVLVLGAGGGFDVALALQAGARQVDAVEVNAAMIEFVRQLGDFCGQLYARREVVVHADEARRFVREAGTTRWDVVQLSLMQTDAAALRSVAGVQSWVMTREAVTAYLDHLTPDGTLAVVQNTAEFAQRTLCTVRAALLQRGVAAVDVPQHVVALALPVAERNPFGQLVLVRTRPFTAAERVALQAQGQRIGATVAPQPPPPADFAVPTDSHPVFYPPHAALLAVYAGLAGGALLAAWWLLARRRRGTMPLPGRTLGQGLLLGGGLMLAQAALLGDAQFALGQPPLAVAWTVGGLLLASGLSALAVAQLRLAPSDQLRRAAWAAAILLPALAVWGPAAGLLAVVPVGLAVGPCFPALLQLAADRHRAAMYAADGLGAVAGGGLAALLYATSGRAAVLGAAAACYAGLAALTRGREAG